MIASLLIYLVFIVLLVPPFGNHGLWGAFMILMAARAVTLAGMMPRLLREF
jgi:MATE family multidrug resistance protein